MNKKVSIFIMLILICRITYSQPGNVEAVNNTLKNTITYQMLNDFQTTVPLFFIVPGFMFAGSVDITHIPVFIENEFFNNIELLKKQNFVQKEIFDVIDVSFMPYIPYDSALLVKVIESNRLLYTLRFEQNGDTLVYKQTSADGRKEKTLYFINGYVENSTFVDGNVMSWVRTGRSGDSLIIETEFDASKMEFFKSIIHLIDGRPSLIEYYKRTLPKPEFRLQASEAYQYEEDKLSGINTFNRRGKLNGSTTLLYINNKLYHYHKSKRGVSSISVNYLYNDLWSLKRKEVNTIRTNYTVEYNYRNETVNQLIIRQADKHYHQRLDFESDINNQLTIISSGRVLNDEINPTAFSRYVFGYLNNGNIESLKVINPKGIIVKDINFEYSYFNK